MIEYINKQAAIIEMMDNDVDHSQGTDDREVVQILEDMPAADVISKADIITLLEETEKRYYKRCRSITYRNDDQGCFWGHQVQGKYVERNLVCTLSGG